MDCVLDTDGGFLKAHRVILAACSPYLKKLLVEYITNYTIPLKEIKYSDMKYLLDFMYYGEVNVPVGDLSSFMKTAKCFQIASLTRLYSNLTDNATCNNSCELPLDNLHPSAFNSDCERGHCTEHGTDGLSEQQDGMSANYEDTEFQSDCGVVSKAIDVEKQPFEVRNNSESQAWILEPTIKKDIVDKDGETSDDHLNPISFVAVSPFSEKVDEHGDTSFMCSDTQLKNPLEEYSNDCELTEERVVKRESNLESELTVQIGYEEEMKVTELHFPNMDMSISQTQKSYPCSDNIPCDGDVKISCDQWDSFVGRSTDLEVNFEAVCDISRHYIKEEKLFGGMTSGNALQIKNEPLIVMEQREKQGPDDSHNVDVCEEVTNVITSTNSSGMEVMEENISSERINPLQVQESNENLVMDETPGSGFMGISTYRYGNGLAPKVQTESTKRMNDSFINCKKSFSQISPNVLVRSQSGEKPFQCEICKNSFTQKHDLEDHMKNHTGEILFPCEICECSFTRKCYLQAHMRSHSEKIPFQCEICKLSFKLKHHLEEHMIIHTGKKQFFCEICKSSYSGITVLNRHMKEIHAKEKFQCEMCESSFTQKRSLDYHMSLHNGKKQFSQYKFPFKSKLKKHMQTHTGEKQFYCEICKSSFSQKSSLNSHMLLHTGKKQFHCEICKDSFIYKSNLMAHMRKHQ